MAKSDHGSRTRQQPARPLTPEAANVLRKFRVIFNSVRKHFRATERKAGVSGAHVWALGVIAEQPGIGVGELAKALDVHQSTVSNLLRTLTAKRLVASERSEADKRAIHLYVTASGQKVLQRAPSPYSGVLPDALLELDPKVLKRLDRDLDRLVAILSPNEDGAYIPLGSSSRIQR